MNTDLTSLELERVVEMIATEAKSSLGRRSLERRKPASSLTECDRAQGELAEMLRFYLREGQLPFAGLSEVSFLREPDRSLELHESWQVLRCARATQALRETFVRNRDDYHLLRTIAETIDDLREVISSVGRFFSQDGKLREESSAELRSIRTKVHTKRNMIQKTLSDLMQRQADAVQEPVITLRSDRYCIPVRTESRRSIPGILHERSGSGASLFIEPLQVVELNNDLAELLIQEREEIARITRFISKNLIDNADSIVSASEISGALDGIQACAIVSDILGGHRPLFVEERTLRILAGRHPLLDERGADLRQKAFGDQESGVNVVPVTIDLDEAHPALLISGPNAGGKTVSLKTAGLLVAMALSGLPVPADDGTTIPVVDSIHVLIGDDQSLLGHLSTFSAYLVRLRRVLERATSQSLVLLDELGSGTDPDEGGALAAAVIEHFLESGSLLIVTTHLSSLKTFAIADARIVNAGMDFDAATGRPTFRMLPGIPGRSRALEIAEMLQLPPAIVRAARERLGDRYVEIDTLLAQLQRATADVAEQTELLSSERAELRNALDSASRSRTALEEQRATLGKKVREQLDTMRDEVTRRLATELRKLEEIDRTGRQKASASAVASSVIEAASAKLDLPDEAPSPEIRVGDLAQHRRFKMTGKVESIDGDRVIISVSGKQVQASRGDLTLVESKNAKVATTHHQESAPDLGVEVPPELNLIGKRVDEAIDEADRFLDRSLLEGKQRVRIIHGFGTGALRKGIREYLRKHKGVTSFAAAEPNDGGDGATVVKLDV